MSILYGVCVGPTERYTELARPALEECCSRESRVLELYEQTNLCEAYNQILDGASTTVDAVTLLHDDVTVCCGFENAVLEASAGPNVAVVGVVGATEVTSLAWWTGRLCGRHPDRVTGTYGTEYGGFGEPVDAVDGCCLVLSRWAIEHLRFDAETFPGFHGYDVDLCFQARAAGRLVTVADLPLVHGTDTYAGFDGTAWQQADHAWRQKWL